MNSITAIQNVSEVPSKLNKTETAEAAKKLNPAVSINGTSFNGASDITTSSWGTSRKITIGNTAKTINGSENVTWSLSDIGALPLSGGTMSGEMTFNNNKSILGKTSSELTTTTGTLASNTSLKLLTYNSSHNLHLGVGIYENNLTQGNTYISAGNNATVRTVNSSGEINFQIGGTTKAKVNSSGLTCNTFIGELNGNAASATTAETADTLKTTRTINGTNFNGSKDITTSTWGTTRSITIGNTSKDVNGSANVSWSLQDIMKGQGLNASTAMNTLYYNNAGTSHVGRLSTYHNSTSSLDYVQLGLYNVANSGTVNTLNVYPEHTYTANEFWCASNIRVNGKRISVTSSAPTTISTGDIWIQI